MLFCRPTSVLLFLCALFVFVRAGADYYEILGVPRTASAKEIRVAFKKLVVRMHPDKNKGDQLAHEKFLKITRAYEVLKDEDTRRRYDVLGEEGLQEKQQGGGHYESWQFYREEFGIYDEDREIITLTRSDFEASVANSQDIWFINFYSAHCSHCHILAPEWRAVARDLEGVVRIGAVNCEDERRLCGQEDIHSYPSLIVYPQKEKYRGERSKERLVRFVLDLASAFTHSITAGNFGELQENHKMPWLVTVCGLDADCCFPLTMKKLAVMLGGLVSVGTIDCHFEGLCSQLKRGLANGGTFFLPEGLGQLETAGGVAISVLDPQEVGRAVLAKLPAMRELSPGDLQEIRKDTRSQQNPSFLVRFYQGSDDKDIELRKLPATLAQISIKTGQFNCDTHRSVCNSLHLLSLPKFVLFKTFGVDSYYGRPTSHDLANFARASVTNPLISLGPEDFPGRVTESGEPWLVEFFSPFCPQCLEEMVHVRAAAAKCSHKVNFGTLDCSIHRALCQQHNIRSFPTVVFYNQTVPHVYHGPSFTEPLLEFIEDLLKPRVIELTPDNFVELVGDPKLVWLVDFFAPWCAPCQRLAIEWRQVAKGLEDKKNVRVGSVDCTAHQQFCRENGVRSYPTIRYYSDVNKFVNFLTHYRDSDTIMRWALDLLPSRVRRISPRFFASHVKSGPAPWVIDFYAPWCGPCQRFAPIFAALAERLPNVRFGKVDCEDFSALCRQENVPHYPAVFLYPEHRLLDENDPDALERALLKLLKLPMPAAAHDEL